MAWVNGYGYGKSLDLPHKNIFLVNDTLQGLRLLRSGRIDCFIDDLTDTNVTTKQMGLNVDDFHFEVINHRHLYPIFTNNARGKKLMAIYEEAMKAMVKSGELFRLYQTVDLNYREILDSSVAGLIYTEPAQAQ
ncbi:transporter substrate-binding domain-containing protein [Dasania sp. GY-MA-18]|uniref:Transporter substrate-binding domain-containing protein n=1 Tax=Dasania phycosphaerae TaxID=2950436 RepID=A0A9J6RRG8_9GAMM|nr:MULTISPECIES: transporter substrate-binding domain-containing protein [Dasania]MCR8924220.1 transporter substrate-binding domain-containing protein [Dasania sp. GY-MA-18]MCZ0866873.1 transporter substrate-binding domain-containing protein [Dasania phycosphaerae]MCZ0870377.1 transporter substrate-binding domain-containing protein [Dasania phycosphaerae]